jgi:hypothetical protein
MRGRYQGKQVFFYFSRRFREVDRFDTYWQIMYFECGWPTAMMRTK